MNIINQSVSKGIDLSKEEEDTIFQKLLTQATQSSNSSTLDPLATILDSVKINPCPGFCIKTRDAAGKIFINVCHHNDMPPPRDIKEKELAEILENPDTTAPFRVPMSLAEGHAEVDKSGNGCTVYDALVNSTFFEKSLPSNSQLFHGFLVRLVMEGLENKYNIELSRDSKFLKILRMKKMGKLQEHVIRKSKSPFIQPMNESVTHVEEKNARKNLGEKPEITLLREPSLGDWPEYLVAEISLPKIRTADSLCLEISAERLRLTCRSQMYHLDGWLPYPVEEDSAAAQFDARNKKLTLTMTVLSRDLVNKSTPTL